MCSWNVTADDRGKVLVCLKEIRILRPWITENFSGIQLCTNQVFVEFLTVMDPKQGKEWSSGF